MSDHAVFAGDHDGKTMMISQKRALLAALIGSGVSLVPELVRLQWLGIILLPGLFVSLSFNGWKVHDPNLFVATSVSALFYTALFYLLFTFVAWLRCRRASGG